MWATASRVRGWLLIEQPGAWGKDALTESGLPPEVGRELARRAAPAHVRILLIRRPQRSRRPSPDRRECFASFTARPSPWLERALFADPEDLLAAVDFGALGRGERFGFGDDWAHPLALVCTNGRHDPCCAQFGRPVVRALAAAQASYRDLAWECTHMGGERFAGNLLCFPHGLYFGRLGPESAVAAVEAYAGGRIALANFRGRAGDPFTVQAAEHFLRLELGLAGIDDVVPHASSRVRPALVEVDFGTPGGQAFRVTVEVVAGDAHPLTCTSSHPQAAPAYRLVGIAPRPPSAGAIH